VKAPSRSRPIPTGPVEDNANPIVFALFVETDKIKALTINAANGSIISTVPCGFDNHGEMTRIFNWDQKREVFYYVEANFTAPPMPQGRQVTLWTIDPRTGKTSGRALGGVYNMPSYFWSCTQDRMFVTTQIVDSQEQPIGARFWAVDPDSGASKLLSTLYLNASSDSYAQWTHAISLDGTTAYRLGFKNVDTQTDPGLSVTNLKAPTAVNTWSSDVRLPTGNHDFYSSCNPAFNTSGNPAFYSLASRQGIQEGYDLVRWELGGDAEVVATLGQDTLPRYFGWVAETLSCDQSVYAALAYKDGLLPILDQWVFSVVDLKTGMVTSNPVEPLLGETDSITGIGLPEATVNYFKRKFGRETN